MTDEAALAERNEAALATTDEQALAQQATAGLQEETPKLPRLKLSQKMTREDVPNGHYINSLTGTDYGESVEFVIAFGPVKGRFFSNRRTGETFTTFAEVAPSFWPEKYAGKRFDELPDAEETFKELANQPGGEWGSGPPIQTTRNYIGYLIEDPDIPVRLSFKSTAAQVADKINSLLRWQLKAPWHNVIDLSANAKTDAQDNPYWVPTAQLGRETTPDERQHALTLAQLVVDNKDSLQLTGDDADDERPSRPAAPEGEDTIGV